MRKTIAKVLSVLAALAIVIGGINVIPATAKADTDKYDMYVAMGGDFNDSGAWDAVGTQVTAQAGVGDTVTIGLEFDEAVTHTYYIVPVIIAEGVEDLDYTIDSITIDGEDVTGKMSFAEDEAWWYEDTDDYSKTEAIRIHGGWNDYADNKCDLAINDIAASGYTSIMYTITINSVNGVTASASDENLDSEETTGDSQESAGTTTDDSTGDSGSTDGSTQTGDMAPIAGIVIALAGCAVVAFAVKKKTVR